MIATAKIIALVAAGALALSGCSAAGVRGTPATSAAECQADWTTDRRAASRGVVNTGSLGAALATGLFSAALSADRKQAANTRFRTCLARFGVTDANAYLAASGEASAPDLATPAPARSGFDRPTAAAIAPQSAGCPQNASVLYGGTTYCTGR